MDQKKVLEDLKLKQVKNFRLRQCRDCNCLEDCRETLNNNGIVLLGKDMCHILKDKKELQQFLVESTKKEEKNG